MAGQALLNTLQCPGCPGLVAGYPQQRRFQDLLFCAAGSIATFFMAHGQESLHRSSTCKPHLLNGQIGRFVVPNSIVVVVVLVAVLAAVADVPAAWSCRLLDVELLKLLPIVVKNRIVVDML